MEQELQRQFWSGLTFSFPYMSWKPQKNRSPHRLPRPQRSPGMGSLMGLVWGIFASRLLGQIVYQANPRDPIVVVAVVLTPIEPGVKSAENVELLRPFSGALANLK